MIFFKPQKMIAHFFLIYAVVLSSLVSGVNADAAESSSAQLSLGGRSLPETRTVSELTNGVIHTKILRGFHSGSAYFTVEAGFYEQKADALQTVEKLKKQGIKAVLREVKNKKVNTTDLAQKTIGYTVYSGEFRNEEEAHTLAGEIKEAGIPSPRITYSDYDGSVRTTGPWQINVLEIELDEFKGRVETGLANDVIQGNERLSSMVQRNGALAAMNGGYFVVGTRDGIPGDLAGVSALDGKLISESIGERTSLLLSGSHAAIAPAKTELYVETADGKTHAIDGLNRKPGLIRSCGGIGDLPSDNPMHDVTCTDASELIQYSRVFGEFTVAGAGYEAVLDEGNVVVETRNARGGKIPLNGKVLSATGDAAQWLKDHAVKGSKLSIVNDLFFDGKKIALQPGMNIVNGAPRLVKDGQPFISAAKEGFQWSNEFYYRFGIYRHPRTLAGIKENGNLLLVTVDGRNPQNSIGISFLESAQILKDLGAKEGMNLDGGGSTTMVIGNKVINTPSDHSGERQIADGIFIFE